ncbi:phage antirepressor [Micrococcus luteus]|nr:phage antirepressor [Micrococcus luteus]MCV7574080.1 phage antirepressor [Micrococcus luteus]
MNAVQPFDYQGREVRTLLIDGEPHFVANDICAVLDLTDPRKSVNLLDEDERNTVPVTDSLGREQMTFVVTEAGMYSLVLRSRKPEAKAFKRWITHEVLPAIRKTGTYSATPALPQDYASALRELAASVEAKAAAEAKVAELQPAASAWSVMVEATGDYSVDEAAKILCRDPRISTGRQRLFGVMADLGWIYRQGMRRRWHAYQTAVETGRVVEKATASFLNARTGEMENPGPTIRVTTKGLEYLHRHLTAEAVAA